MSSEREQKQLEDATHALAGRFHDIKTSLRDAAAFNFHVSVTKVKVESFMVLKMFKLLNIKLAKLLIVLVSIYLYIVFMAFFYTGIYRKQCFRFRTDFAFLFLKLYAVPVPMSVLVFCTVCES
jgi:hypothetical protein